MKIVVFRTGLVGPADGPRPGRGARFVTAADQDAGNPPRPPRGKPNIRTVGSTSPIRKP